MSFLLGSGGVYPASRVTVLCLFKDLSIGSLNGNLVRMPVFLVTKR